MVTEHLECATEEWNFYLIWVNLNVNSPVWQCLYWTAQIPSNGRWFWKNSSRFSVSQVYRPGRTEPMPGKSSTDEGGVCRPDVRSSIDNMCEKRVDHTQSYCCQCLICDIAHRDLSFWLLSKSKDCLFFIGSAFKLVWLGFFSRESPVILSGSPGMFSYPLKAHMKAWGSCSLQKEEREGGDR